MLLLSWGTTSLSNLLYVVSWCLLKSWFTIGRPFVFQQVDRAPPLSSDHLPMPPPLRYLVVPSLFSPFPPPCPCPSPLRCMCTSWYVQEVTWSLWLLALDVFIDYQTLGFTGSHKDKRHITYKAVGFILQIYSICDCGFTYAFCLRNQPLPKITLTLGSHSCMLDFLFVWYPSWKSHECHFNNMYTSAKFPYKFFTQHPKHVRVQGVCCVGGWGVPK